MRADGSRRRPHAIVPAAALVLAALTACSPSTTTPPTATAAPTSQAPTETAAPTADPTDSVTTPPERPDAMSTPSADGAAAAASYFLRLYPYMYATGDTTEWESMSSSECPFCTNSLKGATRVADVENRIEGGDIAIESATGVEVDAGRWYSAQIRATESPSQEIEPAGGIVNESAGGVYDFFFAISFADGSWTIDAVDVSEADNM